MLRFLQDGRFRPLGGDREEVANVRVIVASNRDLKKLVTEGRFREDLLFRLRVLPIVMPPLRDREGDVQLLTDYFLSGCARKYGAIQRRISPNTRTLLELYHWPGNVRELENLIHSELLLEDDEEFRAVSLLRAETARSFQTAPAEQPGSSVIRYAAARSEVIAAFDRDYLNKLLCAATGNVSLAARMAGKERRALGKLLKKYSIATRRSEIMQSPGG